MKLTSSDNYRHVPDLPAGTPALGPADAEGPAPTAGPGRPLIAYAGIAAGVAHAVTFAVFQFGIGGFSAPPPAIAVVIPIEIVTMAEVTTPPPALGEEDVTPDPKKPAEPLPEPPAPPLSIAALPAALDEPEIAPEPVREPIPEPEPVAKTAPLPEPAPKPATPKAPSQLAQARPLSKPKPPMRSNFTTVLRNLEIHEPEKRAGIADGAARGNVEIARATATDRAAIAAAIQRQVQPCWSPPVGAAFAEDLVVRIRVKVDADGTVRVAELLNSQGLTRSPSLEAAADSARRALMNPRCNPLTLPSDRYEYWHDLILNFDPREMFGL